MSGTPACAFKLGDCVRDKNSGDWGYVRRMDYLPGGWTLLIGGGALAAFGMVSAHEIDLEHYDPKREG